MTFLQEAKKEAERRRLAEIENADLKKFIKDTPPLDDAISASETLDIVGKSFNVFDMVMNEIAIADTIHDAITLTRSMRIISDLPKEAQVVNLASTSIRAGRFMFALEALGPIMAYVSFWLDLAGAWAEAKARVFKDNAMRGFSTGVVLGANGANPTFVGYNFWQQARCSTRPTVSSTFPPRTSTMAHSLPATRKARAFRAISVDACSGFSIRGSRMDRSVSTSGQIQRPVRKVTGTVGHS